MFKIGFYEATYDGYVLCGYLSLRDKKVVADIVKGDSSNVTLFKNIMGASCSPAEKKFMAKDPEKWLRSLPLKYSGSYMRAELVEDKTNSNV